MSETRTSADETYLSHRQILVILGGLMTGMFLATLDQSIVGTALPRITSDLNGLNKLSWVVTAYLLTSTAATPLWARSPTCTDVDRSSRQRSSRSWSVHCCAASPATSKSYRLPRTPGHRRWRVDGAGVRDPRRRHPARERGKYMGYMGAVFGTSSVLGPVLGGWLADGPGWEWIFWLNVPIGGVALVVTSYALKLPTPAATTRSTGSAPAS
ncbi:MFS transporter [Aeromicrobium sp. UC242_57]|uniref:MFS transporter n=1 Tax=Aeromicrobium sp. UC242_57 TaxID=3374624 RepID=UPI0037AF3F64